MLRQKTVQELLSLNAEIFQELQRRKLIRSTNNPIADIAEHLAKQALGLDLVKKSTTGYDATDSVGNRYEIKARRPTKQNKSRQLSFIRGLDKDHFTHLVGVLFTEDYGIHRACVIPIDIVKREAKYNKHVNGWRLILADSIWGQPGVRDITDEFRQALERL